MFIAYVGKIPFDPFSIASAAIACGMNGLQIKATRTGG